MAFFVESELKSKYSSQYKRKFEYSSLSLESLNESISRSDYDVFLSHSYNDKELIYAVRQELIDYGLTVYIDWIDDNQLNRARVTKDTAERLKARMENARSLVFVTTENSSTSKWMPWELGYFDGFKGKVAILPTVKNRYDEFKGQEYLGIYEFITKEANSLYVNDPSEKTGRRLFADYLKKELKSWLRN